MKQTGDVEISRENYAEFSLLEEVTGNLTIAAAGEAKGQPIELPVLSCVGGSLVIHRPFEAPQLVSVKGQLSVENDATLVAIRLVSVGGNVELGGKSSLPRLAAVVGDLTVYDVSSLHSGDTAEDDGKSNSHSGLRHHLPALSSVTGRLAVYADIQLPSLTLVGRYFHIGGHSRKGDRSFGRRRPAKASLPLLVCVEESFTIVDEADLSAPLLSLVCGDVSIQARVVLPALSRVTGGLRIRAKERIEMPLLESVTGNVEIDLPPTGVPTELRKPGVARLIDLRGG